MICWCVRLGVNEDSSIFFDKDKVCKPLIFCVTFNVGANICKYMYVSCLLILYDLQNGTTSVIPFNTYFKLSTLLFETIKTTMFGYGTESVISHIALEGYTDLHNCYHSKILFQLLTQDTPFHLWQVPDLCSFVYDVSLQHHTAPNKWTMNPNNSIPRQLQNVRPNPN